MYLNPLNYYCCVHFYEQTTALENKNLKIKEQLQLQNLCTLIKSPDDHDQQPTVPSDPLIGYVLKCLSAGEDWYCQFPIIQSRVVQVTSQLLIILYRRGYPTQG